MKKIIVSVTLLCLLLSSCNTSMPNDTTSDAHTSLEYESSSALSSDAAESDAPQDTESLSVIFKNTPYEYFSPLNFDSFSQLKSAVSEENDDIIYKMYSDAGTNEKQMDKLKAFVEKFRTQKIVVPHLNGEVVKLRDEKDFSNISFFASEVYSLPWVWYFPEVSTGENFYVNITYLPDDILKSHKDSTASDVIKAISPNSPNVDNMGKYHKAIYNKTIKLLDREVTAMISEYEDDNRNSMMFVYDDMLVLVRCNPEIWDEEWFSALSFDSYA